VRATTTQAGDVERLNMFRCFVNPNQITSRSCLFLCLFNGTASALCLNNIEGYFRILRQASFEGCEKARL